MDPQKNAYKEEATELLTELESSLLELEESPTDMDLISRVFRAMHTIKGSGAMFGFDDIAEFTHEVETVFDLVRSEKMTVSGELINLTLAARDQIKSMLEAADSGEKADMTKASDIISGLRKLQGKTDSTQQKQGPSKKVQKDIEEDEFESYITYRIRFKPSVDIFKSGTNPVLLLKELKSMGECRIVAQTDAIPSLEYFNSESCYTYWDIIVSTTRDVDSLRDVFIFVEDESDIRIDIIDEGHSEEDDEYKRLGEILIEREDIKSSELSNILQGQKRLGEILVHSKMVGQSAIDSALAEQQHIREIRKKRQIEAASSSIRVAADKLDRLVDLVGELVTVQATLTQKANVMAESTLMSIAEEVERLTSDLRDNTMSIRMLPIGSTFSKFKRLVRDLSLELGKDVNMTDDGGKTELDKTVIERLNDPMVHIIRNSIDHGIEMPEVREKAGKPKQGTIHLEAAHSGANVLIRISDDGAGLNTDAIRSKAIEKGLVPPDQELSESELFHLIFLPGFSTAAKVTDVSGRGVGMDVVKSSIETLRGTIEISSKHGAGTTITLKLPLTLAIIDGLLVEIGHEFFVMPLSTVEECVELTRSAKESNQAKNGKRNIAIVRDEIVPYIPLRDLFNISGPSPSIEQVVITEVDGARIGFVVDHIIGEHQTVIKTLGRVYRKSKEFSGATILADGTVALILDVQKLSEIAESEEYDLSMNRSKN